MKKQKKQKKQVWLRTAVVIVALVLGLAALLVWNDKREETKIPSYTLTEEKAMPIPPAQGRGEPMEDLVPMYGSDYEEDPMLGDLVSNYRRWEWPTLYAKLDQIVRENPDYLDAYCFQAEVYMINQNYEAALSQIDQVLLQNPGDIHGLGLSTILMHILGNKEGEAERLSALRAVSPEAAADVQTLLSDVEESLAQSYGSQLQTDMVPEAIIVFGQTPKPDGTPSAGLLSRLERTLELAQRFPEASVIVSGGDVKTEYTEASVMKEWLMQQGVEGERILLDEMARDTYGNAIGSLALCEEIEAHKAAVVATIFHLPRAVTTMKLYAEHKGYPLELDWAGGGEQSVADEGERLYTFVNGARAVGLFTKGDFENY